MKKIILILLVGILIISLIGARSSGEFIDHLTEIIYKDCEGKDLDLTNANLYSDKEFTKKINLISWPNYSIFEIRKIIEKFSEGEPYMFWQQSGKGGISIGDKNGFGILKCDPHNLDINRETYYWDKVKVDIPREEFKITYGQGSPIIEIYGDQSPVTTGDNSPINQTNIWIQLFWSKGTMGGVILSIILSLIYKKRKNIKQFLEKLNTKKPKK